MKGCAYCNKQGSLTKEHIWPRSLITKYEGLKAFNPRINSFYNGEPVIKDVCATCNNIHLSKLDSYLSELHEKYLQNILSPGDAAFIEYDYNLLLRALLKISYNSARAFAEDKTTKLLSKYSRFIIDNSYSPKTVLRLQIVTASKRINIETGVDEGLFEPVHLRCGTIDYDGRLSHRFLVRMVAINCFWFYMISSYKTEPEHIWRKFLEGLRDWITPTGITLSPNMRELIIPREQTTYMHPVLLGKLRTAKHA
jgi:hypothetical protein